MQMQKLAMVAAGLTMMLGVPASLWAQSKEADLAVGGGGRSVRWAGEKQRRQWQQSGDAGDFYNTPQGRRPLRRSSDQVVVRGRASPQRAERVAILKSTSDGWRHAAETDWGEESVILTLSGGPESRMAAARKQKDRAASAPVQMDLAAMRRESGAQVDPVFVDPDSGLLMVMEPEIVVCLNEGVDVRAYFGETWALTTPLAGTRDQFLLRREGLPAEDILADCIRRSGDPRVRWAEPNFRSEGVRHYTPNDPNFGSQWHLRTGAVGCVAAQTAWDSVKGAGLVIAIVDDGVQTNHPDLQGNLAAGQTNVVAGTANAMPAAAEDNHGTGVAGVAAAVGHNSLGVAGAAFQSQILPVKIATGESTFATDAQIATAFRYAAGLVGGAGWEGADVINFSWSWTESTALNSALADATANGRGGLGCPVFVSAGNDGGGWYYFAVPVAAGPHTFRFEYLKDVSDNAGEDCVWLDDVFIPGIGTESFEGATFPPTGWTTGGSGNWTQAADNLHAMGTGIKSAKSGAITHSQSTWLQTIRTTGAGDVTFWLWTSTEKLYDVFNFYVDGVIQDPYGYGEGYTDPGGVYGTTTTIAYPASHPDTIAVGASTDCDYRSDYSQYGTGLDFVTASSGGTNGIWTTDRTGTDGYVSGDYDDAFGGTSSASPLAAGIGALVLSKNPDLTAAEVRSILRKSCAKIGGVAYAGGDAGAGGWNTYYGYGKLMATLALDNTPSPGGAAFSGISAASGSPASLPFLSPAGVECILQYTTNLAATPVVWVQADVESGTGGEIVLQDGSPSDPARMYRVTRGP